MTVFQTVDEVSITSSRFINKTEDESPLFLSIITMISFNRLGNLGRLSNQMFQYASLKGIARNRGLEFCIPPKGSFGAIDSNVRNSDANLYTVFDIESKNTIQITDNQTFTEQIFHFDENLFNSCSDNIDLFGYYQSEKYFSHIEDEIRSDFKFSDELTSQCKDFYDSNFENIKVISLHVRRTDYISNPNHPVPSDEYYKNALSNFDSDLPVIVFSDDSEWCKNHELFSEDRFYISENNTTDFDLCLMSMCNYHIIANSSYSWWGSWLAKSEKTIAPKIWFGGDCINHNTKDLYLSDWTII